MWSALSWKGYIMWRHIPIFIPLCILVLIWPAMPPPVFAQQPMPTPVRLETDTLDYVMQDFLDPCRAVQSYMLNLGWNPASSSQATRRYFDRSWDILAVGLAYVAAHPEVAQSPVGLRAEIRDLLPRLARAQGAFYVGDEARRMAEGLDGAVDRWQTGAYGTDEAAGLALVAAVMSDPDRASVYRSSVQYAGVSGDASLRATMRAPMRVCP
jgi:hypothetical protein